MKRSYEDVFNQHRVCSNNVCIHKWNENAYNVATVLLF